MFSRICVPQTDGIIPTPAGKRVAINTESNVPDRFRMALERSQSFSRFGIPQTDGIIFTPACECTSIGTERNTKDSARMPLESSEEFSPYWRSTGGWYRLHSH